MTSRREAAFSRATKETDIRGRLIIDGSGQTDIKTGIGFFDHMLTTMCFNGHFDLSLRCIGDLEVDQHHTVEDVGIALGEAYLKAMKGFKGVRRYGSMLLPMDEVLARVVVDLSGRCYLQFHVPWAPHAGLESFNYHLVREFHWGFCRVANITSHIDIVSPGNNHHMCEATFKAFGRALGEASEIDPRRRDIVPSTKGTL